MTSAFAEIARYAATPLPRLPLLVPWVEPVETGDDLLELRAEESFYPLRHPALVEAFRAIGERLDGRHEVDRITSDLPPGVAPATAVFLLKTLTSTGLLLDSADLADGGEEAAVFFSHFGPAAAGTRTRLERSRVVVRGRPDSTARIVEELHGAGVGSISVAADRVPDSNSAADLILAWAEAPSDELLREVNLDALELGVPWLRVVSNGPNAWLGPLVLPGETACQVCLEARQEANLRDPSVAFRGEASAADFTPMRNLLAVQASLEVSRFLGGFAAPATVGGVFELKAFSPHSPRHDVLRNPNCGICASRSLRILAR